jgi:hypothetical protein
MERQERHGRTGGIGSTPGQERRSTLDKDNGLLP